MVRRNPHFENLSEGYLFPEVNKQVSAYRESHPNSQLISLSIGDTTQPIPRTVSTHLQTYAEQLATDSGYQGYGDEQGNETLRHQIATQFYPNMIDSDEVFVSDGAKCDLGRLQMLFGSNLTYALQDPTYPVYLDTSLMMGAKKIHFLPCTAENDFCPDLSKLPSFDILYLCSPNNPTGTVLTHEQLTQLVKRAKEKKALIIFDTAYRGFIQDPTLPRSIYEIEGAKEVAIEVCSFSKLIGFTGIRLGWTVVPKALKYHSGKNIHTDWKRVITTCFNGASNLAQAGGLAALTPQGLDSIKAMTSYYLENAKILKTALSSHDTTVYGGDNAPYLWVHFPGETSWTRFQTLLETHQIISIPGVGFGPSGENYLRFSTFGKREHIEEAAQRLTRLCLT